MLGAAADLIARETGSFKLVIQHLDGLIGGGYALFARLLHHAGDALILLRLQVEEGKVFELPFDRADAQTVCQGRIDIHGLAGFELAAIRL